MDHGLHFCDELDGAEVAVAQIIATLAGSDLVL